MSGERTTHARRNLPPVSLREEGLRIVYSPDRAAVGRLLPFDGESYTLGRAARGIGEVQDPRLSREHVRVGPHAALGGYGIEDLDSSNGTFLDARPLTGKTKLVPGAVVSAGDTLLVVDAEPSPDQLPADPDQDETLASEVRGGSYAAARIRRAIATVAEEPGPVLVLGPTGTGKEVTAQAIHRLSGRRGRLVSVNCAAIPADLAEAELFGARRGAYTGADADRPGYFVESNGGTIFLDEVGDLAPAIQAKLLRVLEDSSVQPVGGGAPTKLDLRVVAATQVDLDQSGFRADLFARLGEWVLHLPPLAARRADILTLVDHFSEGQTPELTPEFAEALLLHDWRENVRELRKLVRRLSGLHKRARAWDLPMLPEAMQAPIRQRGSSDRPVLDKVALEAAIKQAGGNISKLATELGYDRRTIYRWMKKLGVDPESVR